MVLGKRKAESQLTPESEGKDSDRQEKRFFETVGDFPLSTPEEIANRPPLVARRRGSKPAVTPIGNAAFAGTDPATSAETQTPEPAQPVGDAPGVAATAEQEKQKVAEESQATEPSPAKETTSEDGTEKKSDNKPGSNWFSGPSPFANIESNKFTAGSNPFAPSTSEDSSNPFATSTTSNPFMNSGSSFSFGDSSSSGLSFSLPTNTPSTLGEAAASKEPLVKEQKVTTGEEDEEKVYSDTVRLYQLCVPEVKEGEGEGDGKDAAPADKPEKKWIQRGRGELRLNCLKAGGGKARIIVRREKTHQLLINMPLFCNITCKRASDCDLRIVGFNQGPDSSDLVPESYLIRQRDATNSAELEKHLNKFVHPPGSIDPSSPVEANNKPAATSTLVGESTSNDTTTSSADATAAAPAASTATATTEAPVEAAPAKSEGEEKPAESTASGEEKTEAPAPAATETTEAAAPAEQAQ